MVHADASTFAAGVTKKEAYEQVLDQLKGLLDGQRNWVCNTANAASLLWHCFQSLPAPLSRVNWAGFYVLDASTPDQLILGPFQGGVACQTIAFKRGVCGYAATHKMIQVVGNVEAFPGHIACDGNTKSECVVPILVKGKNGEEKVVGVLDVDCEVLSGFEEEDALFLNDVAELLAAGCDW